MVISDTEQSPQRGQHTPVGQRSFSIYSRQVSSSPKRSINDIKLILAVLDMTHTRRKKDKLSGDVRKLKGDDIMEKVFSKKVVKELKKVAHEKDSQPPKAK